MSIYCETLQEATAVISDEWKSRRQKPALFAKVRIRFGEKYMIDYDINTTPPDVAPIDDLMHTVDGIIRRA